MMYGKHLGLSVCVCVCVCVCVSHSVLSDSLTLTPQTVVCQAPLSMEFSRQEYWSGLPFPSPGNLPNPGIKPWSPTLQADSLSSELPGMPLGLSTHIKYIFNSISSPL